MPGRVRAQTLAFSYAVALTASLLSATAAAQTLLATIPTGASPAALAINPVTNKIYVANQDANTVTIIDGATNRTATVSVGAGPSTIALNSRTNKIYIGNTSGSTVTVIDGATNRTATVTTGAGPIAIAVNPVTNKIYVANYTASTVTVIDGSTNHTTNLSVGRHPYGVAVNTVTNKIFVIDYSSADMAAIDGATNAVTMVGIGASPSAIAVDEVTNHVYVANDGSGTVSVVDGVTYAVTNLPVPSSPVSLAVDQARDRLFVANSLANTGTLIDGATLSLISVAAGDLPVAVKLNSTTAQAYFVNSLYQGTLTMVDELSGSSVSVRTGHYPVALAINELNNRIYVANGPDNTVSVIAGGPASALEFVPATPCRVADTRLVHGPFGGPSLPARSVRTFAIPQSPCAIPANAAAYSLNVAVVPKTGRLDYLTVWPTGQAQPYVSTLNSPDGRVKANAAIVPAGSDGAISVYVTDATDVILDINGYFQVPDDHTLQLFPLPPCRVLDTRWDAGSLGGPYLHGGVQRDFPVLASNCQVPSTAQAYSMNFAVAPVNHTPLGYLTVWPAGTPQPYVSTLNNPTATTLANAAIVPAGANGAISVYGDRDTHLIGDINGYFAPGPGGLSLHALPLCRVLDTRSNGGAFSGKRNPPVPVATSGCYIPPEASAYVFAAAVVPTGSLGYLTLWADGDPIPYVSTLNATDGMTASNMAIVANRNGKLDAYAYGLTQLILDITGYFAP